MTKDLLDPPEVLDADDQDPLDPKDHRVCLARLVCAERTDHLAASVCEDHPDCPVRPEYPEPRARLD